MSPNPSVDDGGLDGNDVHEPPPLELVAEVHHREGVPDACAIFPEGSPPPPDADAWIAALGDSFVDLEVMR